MSGSNERSAGATAYAASNAWWSRTVDHLPLPFESLDEQDRARWAAIEAGVTAGVPSDGYPRVVWRGSVTDLATDLRPLLSEEDRGRLAVALTDGGGSAQTVGVDGMTDEAFVSLVECALAIRPRGGHPILSMYVPEMIRRFRHLKRGVHAFGETLDGVRGAIGQKSTHYLLIAEDVGALVKAVERCEDDGGCYGMTALRKLREQ